MIERQSNIELLRILSILALLLLHFCIYSLYHSVAYANQTGFWEYFPRIVCSLTTIQVNIFVLISGWFGIRTNIKKIISFYLICVFYALLTYGLSFIDTATTFSIKNFILSFLPFSFLPGWWFVKAYLVLMLLAPLFNKAIEHMSKQEYIWVLCALTLINVYYGFLSQQPINPHGTNFMQLMYMYFIGRYLALHVSIGQNKLRKWSAIFAIIGIAIYSVIWIANDHSLHIVNSLTFFNNNNPLAIFNAIVIFLFFTTIPFQSRPINWLAKGVFPVYLIHQSVWISQYWNNNLSLVYDSFSPGIAWIVVSAICMVYCFTVLCFDHIRAWITNPIVNKV